MSTTQRKTATRKASKKTTKKVTRKVSGKSAPAEKKKRPQPPGGSRKGSLNVKTLRTIERIQELEKKHGCVLEAQFCLAFDAKARGDETAKNVREGNVSSKGLDTALDQMKDDYGLAAKVFANLTAFRHAKLKSVEHKMGEEDGKGGYVLAVPVTKTAAEALGKMAVVDEKPAP